MSRPTDSAHYRTRRWPVRLAIALVVAAIIGAFIVPRVAQWASDREERAQTYVPDVVSTPTPSTTPSTIPTSAQSSKTLLTMAPDPIRIASSTPTELYMPSDNPKFAISTKLLPLECGYDIPYPTSGPTVWRGFYCTDYGLPGTDTPHYGIITGHSTLKAGTVMNHLMVQGKGLVGKRIYVRTQASGDRWLIYEFRTVHWVDKPDLGQATELWGDKNTSTAGRLVFLTCQQIAPGVQSAQNFGAVAQFVGVR